MFKSRFPRSITAKSASAVTLLGVGAYCAQSRLISTANAESNEPPKVFSGFGFTTLRLQSTKDVNHNTKRLVFEFPDQKATSGLALTCMDPTYDQRSITAYILTYCSGTPHHIPSRRTLVPRTTPIYTNQRSKYE